MLSPDMVLLWEFLQQASQHIGVYVRAPDFYKYASFFQKSGVPCWESETVAVRVIDRTNVALRFCWEVY